MKALQIIKKYTNDILHLIYPEVCVCCEEELASLEKNFCTICKSELHFTHYEHYKDDTTLSKLFWGRVELHATFSLLYYKDNLQSRHILHQLKYKNRAELAIVMGEMIGERIKQSSELVSIDLLIPVPLHPKKKFIRGYNQSEAIASGICKTSSIPVNTTLLSRKIHTESQTKKGKFERWDNVKDAFYIEDNLPEDIQHIALVDDVITTGSTLETIVQTFQKKYNLKISIISIAYAGG